MEKKWLISIYVFFTLTILSAVLSVTLESIPLRIAAVPFFIVMCCIRRVKGRCEYCEKSFDIVRYTRAVMRGEHFYCSHCSREIAQR